MTAEVAVIGSGNIGTDPMINVLRTSPRMELAALVGVDPASDGLARAARTGVLAVPNGVQGLMALPALDDIALDFDATSTRLRPMPTDAMTYASGTRGCRSLISRPRLSGRSPCPRSILSPTWAPGTSTWSAAAGRPPCPSSRQSRA